MKTFNMIAVAAMFALNAIAADVLTERLQRGLFEEEANHDLDAAIKEYQSIISLSDEQRKVMATAIFRLGECYRKLGRTNEANAQYQRVLRDFSEQEQLVRSVNSLMGPGVMASQPEYARELRGRIAVLRIESIAAREEANRLAQMTTNELAQSEAAQKESRVAAIEQQLQTTEQRLATLQGRGLADGHPDVVATKELRNTILKQRNAGLTGLVVNAKARADSLSSQLNALVAELKAAGTSDGISTANVSMNSTSEKLLREEIALAEQQVQITEKKLEAGKSTLDEVLRVKQDVLRLKRMLPENNPPAQQKVLLSEQIAIVQKLHDETQRRVAVGVIAPGEDVPLKRELLALQRELSVVSDVATSSGPTLMEKFLSHTEAEELARVRTLAKNSPDLLQSPGKDGLSQLQLAARDGHYSVAEFILEQGVSPDGPEHGSPPPLLLAAGRGHLRIVGLLLDKGADVNAANSGPITLLPSYFSGQTALMTACENGFRSVVELLLERGAEVNRASSFNTIALHYAALKGRTSIAELLLKRGSKTDVVSKDRTQFKDWPGFSVSGATPLHLATEQGITALVELLLKSGASVSISNHAGNTPLHLASSLPNTAVCTLLLEKGANPNAEMRDGSTPLSTAIANNRPEIVALLLAKGADVNRPIGIKSSTSYPQYPLHLAISRNSRVLLDALLGAKPDLGVINRDGHTPLVQVLAGSSPSVELAEGLLEAGANPNNAAVNTLPIWYCIGKGPRIVGALLRYGANPNVLDYAARTPLSYIQESINNALRSPSEPRVLADLRETEQLLRKYGANENLRRLSAIDYTRPAWTSDGNKVFYRGTNDYNRYTLFELLTQVFTGNNAPSFPDFSRVSLERLEGTNTKPRGLALDVEEMVRGGCSNDVWLEWGDRISFPELDHPLNESWPGISKEMRDLLIHCGTRRVQIVVKQETNVVKLVPNMSQPVPMGGAFFNPVVSGILPATPLRTDARAIIAQPVSTLGGSVASPPPMTREQAEAIIDSRRQALENQGVNPLLPPTRLATVPGQPSGIPAPPPDKPEKTLTTFRLKEVVYGANVLRASSDPTRVRVTRREADGKKEWLIDLTKVALPNENRTVDNPAMPTIHDFWLRDGDLIEIPEKQ